MIAGLYRRICIRISTVRDVGVEKRLVVVLVLRTVLVFHGCVHMKQRRRKHSNQESSTEYRHTSLSHYREMLFDADATVKRINA